MRVNNRYKKQKPKRNMSIKKPIKHSHQENAKYTHLPKFATSYFPLCIFACEGAPMEHHKVTKANERKCEDTRTKMKRKDMRAKVRWWKERRDTTLATSPSQPRTIAFTILYFGVCGALCRSKIILAIKWHLLKKNKKYV